MDTISIVAIFIGVTALLVATLASIIAGEWVHFAIIMAVLTYTAGVYLWVWRRDPGYAIRRLKEFVRC